MTMFKITTCLLTTFNVACVDCIHVQCVPEWSVCGSLQHLRENTPNPLLSNEDDLDQDGSGSSEEVDFNGSRPKSGKASKLLGDVDTPKTDENVNLQVRIYPAGKMPVLNLFSHIGVQVSGNSRNWETEYQFCESGISPDNHPNDERLQKVRRNGKIDILSSGLSSEEVDKVRLDMQKLPEWQGERYQTVLNNCQDFAFAFLVRLKKTMEAKEMDADTKAAASKQFQDAIERVHKERTSCGQFGKWFWGGLRKMCNWSVNPKRATCCENEECKKKLWTGFDHTCRACKKRFCSKCSERGPPGTYRIELEEETWQANEYAAQVAHNGQIEFDDLAIEHDIVVKNPKYLCECCKRKCTEDTRVDSNTLY